MSYEIWSFKYEPTKFEDMILNEDLKPILKKKIKEIPNFSLVGPPGIGKSTFSKLLIKENNLSSLEINASDESSIDDMRGKVKSYATALGEKNKIKIVVLNECDRISAAGQKSIKELIEKVQKITRFILITNYPHMIIDELYSRCPSIEISNPPAKDIFSFCNDILKKEKIKVKNKKAVISIIKRFYPDIREIIHTLQENCIDGVLDKVIFSDSEALFEKILELSLTKDIDEVRKILKSNTIDYTGLYSFFFENINKFKMPAEAILSIRDGLYKDKIVGIREINFIGMIVEMIKNGVI